VKDGGCAYDWRIYNQSGLWPREMLRKWGKVRTFFFLSIFDILEVGRKANIISDCNGGAVFSLSSSPLTVCEMAEYFTGGGLGKGPTTHDSAHQALLSGNFSPPTLTPNTPPLALGRQHYRSQGCLDQVLAAWQILYERGCHLCSIPSTVCYSQHHGNN
jgi:hypothetical protein